VNQKRFIIFLLTGRLILLNVNSCSYSGVPLSKKTRVFKTTRIMKNNKHPIPE